MTIERMRAADAAEPFRPFTTRLADGRGVPVLSREFFAHSPAGRTVVVFQPDESFNVVDLVLVTDLEFRPTPNQPAAA